MNRFHKVGNVLCLLIAVVSVVFLLTAMPQKAEAADLNHYGYKMLENSKQKQAYETLADAMLSGISKVSFSQMGITQGDFTKALNMVLIDYPEIFWIGTGYTISKPQGKDTVESVEFNCVFSEQGLQSASTALNNKVNQIVAGVPSGSDYKKALYLHDYIVNNVDYQDAANDQSAYGALVEGKAVCAGYTHAYQLLLRRVGIDSLYIKGTAKGDPHAWLLVWLDGECYYTDVTWDDKVATDGKHLTAHYYFNMSYDDISKDHVADAMYNQILPSHHAHKKYYYFEQEKGEGKGVGWFTSSTPPEALFNYLKQDGKTYTCDFYYDGSDWQTWLNSAIRAISARLGMLTPRCDKIENEYVLTLTLDREHSLSLKSDATRHWQWCSTCGTEIPGTSAAHSDSDGNYACDDCGYKLPGGSSSTQNTPSSGSPSSTPSGGTDTPSGSITGPSTGESTTAPGGNELTQGTTAPDSPDTNQVEGTMPSGGSTDITSPPADAEGDPSAPTQNQQKPQHDGESGTDNTFLIIAVSAVVVLGGAGAAAVVIIRKKRIS